MPTFFALLGAEEKIKLEIRTGKGNVGELAVHGSIPILFRTTEFKSPTILVGGATKYVMSRS